MTHFLVLRTNGLARACDALPIGFEHLARACHEAADVPTTRASGSNPVGSASHTRASTVALVCLILQVGNYQVGEEGDLLLTGHPNIRY